MQRWLHGGALLGWPDRILVFLVAVALPVPFTTGLLAWLAGGRSRGRIAVQRLASQARSVRGRCPTPPSRRPRRCAMILPSADACVPNPSAMPSRGIRP